MNPLPACSFNNSLSPGEFLEENKNEIYLWIKSDVLAVNQMLVDIGITMGKMLQILPFLLSILAVSEFRSKPLLSREYSSLVINFTFSLGAATVIPVSFLFFNKLR